LLARLTHSSTCDGAARPLARPRALVTTLVTILARSPGPAHDERRTPQDDGDHNEPFVAFALEVSLSKCPPAVFSISYTDEEDSATHRYAKRFAVEMAKAGAYLLAYFSDFSFFYFLTTNASTRFPTPLTSLLVAAGARGITVLVASGDNGSGGAWREPCHGRFQPTFPSAVPWVTAVGGTATRAHARSRRAAKALEFGRADFTEVAHPQYVYSPLARSPWPTGSFWSSSNYPRLTHTLLVSLINSLTPLLVATPPHTARTRSSGGFSAIFKRPPYQDAAVRAYLGSKEEPPSSPGAKVACERQGGRGAMCAHALPPRTTFAAHGRGYPDISAMYSTYAIVCGGQDVTISGTR
jgi:hypothetical protein